ncbi:helix-turn-helix domain-containing protein [Streptomyces sp. ODS28]|uniref:helix-turn-helix domain-containing protein n=1 Tax=Streptomyces sp. ODS28 TaxID=3136688 RepID=UPI0031EB808F
MTAHAVQVLSRVSTDAVPPGERVDFWEEHNRRALVGLACSPYADGGLSARQTNLRFGALRLADIRGNEHVIERTPGICRRLPKDSVFASLVLSGEAVFYHGSGCLTLGAGDLALYDTRGPYLFGFASAMRQLLVDVPAALFRERCAAEVPEPLRFRGGGTGPGTRPGTGSGAGEGAVLDALRGALERVAGGGAEPGTDGVVLDLLRTLVTSRSGGPAAPPPLAAAYAYVERHLGDPGLSVPRVAAAAGVSERHLGRLFAASGSTPGRHILHRRLDEAYRELSAARGGFGTVAALAHRWGFATHAHFTRSFRERFGRTPGEVRTP